MEISSSRFKDLEFNPLQLLINQNDSNHLKTILLFHLYAFLTQKFNLNLLEEEMINPKLIRLLLIELIKDGEYTLDGIAYSTRIPADVIHDIAYGINTNPSMSTTLQIIFQYIISKRTEYTEKLRYLLNLLDTKATA